MAKTKAQPRGNGGESKQKRSGIRERPAPAGRRSDEIRSGAPR